MAILKTRGNYWSNSKLAHKILKFYGYDKPSSATSEGWEEWETKLTTEIPFIYWVIDKLFNKIQDILYYPSDIFYHYKQYIVNRYISKTHAIVTTLSKGDWHESSELILYGMFQVLVNFVEVEKSNMYYWCHSEERPWYYNKFFKWTRYREPEKGLKYLEWEISLTDESPHQAESAAQVLELYNWWVHIRPNRPDPWKASGLEEYYKSQDDGTRKSVWKMLNHNRDSIEQQRVNDMRHRQEELEQQYVEEDTNMLIRLIKLRDAMWT